MVGRLGAGGAAGLRGAILAARHFGGFSVFFADFVGGFSSFFAVFSVSRERVLRANNSRLWAIWASSGIIQPFHILAPQVRQLFANFSKKRRGVGRVGARGETGVLI